ncbi:MAG TPA: MarR family winged helix-turn-helix transcriptional regulator [Burkholderiaceae bacterium]|jgi:DNA-binding MarR family transcriptional regulator
MSKTIDTVNDIGRSADVDILELVHSLMHEYRALQYRSLRDGPLRITHMDGKTLDYFARHPGSTQSEFAQYIGRDKAQLARLVGPLCEKGLLERAADAADKRTICLSVTSAGRAVLKSIQTQSRRLSARATAGLSEVETRKLAALLERVKANITAED